jgi:choline-phosphate cytidylyltransferase
VFTEESLELKRHYLVKYSADVLVMGHDWTGRFDHLGDICEVVYLPRTPSISTTATIERIQTLPPAASG